MNTIEMHGQTLHVMPGITRFSCDFCFGDTDREHKSCDLYPPCGRINQDLSNVDTSLSLVFVHPRDLGDYIAEKLRRSNEAS